MIHNFIHKDFNSGGEERQQCTNCRLIIWLDAFGNIVDKWPQNFNSKSCDPKLVADLKQTSLFNETQI